MAKKVVQGGPIRFKDDLPIAAAEVVKPLALPPLELFPDQLTLWFKARFFELERRPGEDQARIWNRPYGLREAEPAAAREARWASAHRAAIEAAQRGWLERVVGGAAEAPGGAGHGAQLLHAVAEKVEELCAVALRPPRRDIGGGRITRRADVSVLAGLQGYERVLIVDGKVYELLTLAEYLDRFEKAFDPTLLAELHEDCETRTPAEVCARMALSLDRVDKKTYGVIKGKVHYDERTFQLRLDGVFLIPEYLCPLPDLLATYRALWERRLKLAIAKGG